MPAREPLRDVDRVVARAVGGGAVAERAALVAARARGGLAGRDPRVADLGRGEVGRGEHLLPIAVHVRRDGREELLHRLRLLRVVAAAGDQVLCVCGGGSEPAHGAAAAVVGPRGAEVVHGPGEHQHQSGAGQQAGAGQDSHDGAVSHARLKGVTDLW